MKKKTLLCVLGGLLVAVAVRAGINYSANLVNETAIAYAKRFVLDLKTGGRGGTSIKTVAATAVYSNGTPSSTSFTDGSVGSGTLTVGSTSSLVAVSATNTITVASTTSLKNAILVVQGSGSQQVLRQGYQWSVGATPTATATSIAAILNRVSGIQASSAGSVVYATATVAGTAGNAFTLSKISAANLTLGGGTFAGGVADAFVQIGGITLTRGANWAVGASTALTAANIANAVRANSTLNALVSPSTSSAVVTITAKAVGVAGNLSLASGPGSLTNSGVAMTGGTDSAYVVNATSIHKTAHGLTTALPVLYTSTVTLTGLTTGTTYYAYRVDADNFKLSDTSTGAVAGVGFRTLASGSTAGPHTFTLAPLSIAGTFGFKWQVSDDNATWSDMSVSSVTFGSPYTSGNANWDFGTVGHRYVGVLVSSGTAGGMAVTVGVTGRNN